MQDNVLTGFERHCRGFPDKAAIVYLGASYSYRELDELSDRFATALASVGVNKDDRVVLYLQNCVQWVIALFAIWKAGGVPVPVSHIYTPEEITYMINNCGAKIIICQDTNFGYVAEVMPKTCLKQVIYTNIGDFLPFWKRAVGLLFDKVPRGRIRKGTNTYSFLRLTRSHRANPPKMTIAPREQLAYILHTGGTTGLPKGVPGSHALLWDACLDYQEFLKEHLGEGEGVLLIANPLFHIMGLATILALGLTLGNTTVLMPVPQVDAVQDVIQRYKVNLMLGVPAFYRMILDNDRVDSYDMSSLRYCWCGGDVLPGELFNRWRTRVGVPIYQNFGATETVFVGMSPLDEEPSPNVIGRVVASKRIRIFDPHTLGEVPVNTAGEIAVTTDHLMEGYWNNTSETESSFVILDGVRYYRMKDVVLKNDKSDLVYVDRGADIIKYKGYRISCSEIEAVLQDHDAVTEACVVGTPDDKFGERIKAIVVLREGVRGVGAGDLIHWCRERLSPVKIPHHIEFRDMLPKSKVGKLLRRDVREEERRKAGKPEGALGDAPVATGASNG